MGDHRLGECDSIPGARASNGDPEIGVSSAQGDLPLTCYMGQPFAICNTCGSCAVRCGIRGTPSQGLAADYIASLVAAQPVNHVGNSVTGTIFRRIVGTGGNTGAPA